MWKATEFRQFLLYTGPVVLLGKLNSSRYKNFIPLSVCVCIVLKTNRFKQMVLYNVHSLLHIVDDVRTFGSLDSVSCFPFENFLGRLKKMIRKPQNILPQLLCQLDENDVFSISETIKKTSTKHKFQHFNGLIVNGYEMYNQLKQYKSDDLFITLSYGDNCVFIDSNVCVIKNILVLDKSAYVACSSIIEKESVSNYPFDLKLLGTY